MAKEYNEKIMVMESRMKCSRDAEHPITHVASEIMKHYECPWRAAEDVAIQTRRIMTEQGWTLTPPNVTHDPLGKQTSPSKWALSK